MTSVLNSDWLASQSAIYSPARHLGVAVQGYVRHGLVVVLVVTVRCSKPLVKAVTQWQILRLMAKMPGYIHTNARICIIVTLRSAVMLYFVLLRKLID